MSTPFVDPTTRSSRRHFILTGAGVVGGLVVSGRLEVRADDSRSTSATSDLLTAKAVDFLKPRQEENGGWSTKRNPGITGIVVTALLRSRRVTPADPTISKGLTYLEGLIN